VREESRKTHHNAQAARRRPLTGVHFSFALWTQIAKRRGEKLVDQTGVEPFQVDFGNPLM
jgi:hypothetical protein